MLIFSLPLCWAIVLIEKKHKKIIKDFQVYYTFKSWKVFCFLFYITLFILRLITLLANIDRSIINKMVFYRMDVRYEFQYFGNVFIM